MSDWFSPGFFDSGVTRPCFSDDGNTPLLKDMLAYLAMTGAMTSTLDFSVVVGMKSVKL